MGERWSAPSEPRPSNVQRLGLPETLRISAVGLSSLLSVGWQQIRRAPIASGATLLVQAIGIAGVILIFGLVTGVRERRPRGIEAADNLVQLRRVPTGSSVFSPSLGWFSYAEFLALRNEAKVLSNLGASVGMRALTIQVGPTRDVVQGGLISSGYLNVLGVNPLLGRG